MAASLHTAHHTAADASSTQSTAGKQLHRRADIPGRHLLLLLNKLSAVLNNILLLLMLLLLLLLLKIARQNMNVAPWARPTQVHGPPLT
jgi:hypothetical protein